MINELKIEIKRLKGRNNEVLASFVYAGGIHHEPIFLRRIANAADTHAVIEEKIRKICRALYVKLTNFDLYASKALGWSTMLKVRKREVWVHMRSLSKQGVSWVFCFDGITHEKSNKFLGERLALDWVNEDGLSQHGRTTIMKAVTDDVTHALEATGPLARLMEGFVRGLPKEADPLAFNFSSSEFDVNASPEFRREIKAMAAAAAVRNA